MYKSSSLTFIHKYLLAPLWAGLFLFKMISNWTSEDQFLRDLARDAPVIAGWGLFWLTILSIRLRNVVATNEGLIIKKIRGKEEIIKYKDIEYVSQINVGGPLISLKYRDNRTGESNKILVMPGTSSDVILFNFSKELEMTKFIRRQILRSNPDYNTDAEPSRWSTVGIILLTGLCFYLMNSILTWMSAVPVRP